MLPEAVQGGRVCLGLIKKLEVGSGEAPESSLLPGWLGSPLGCRLCRPLCGLGFL